MVEIKNFLSEVEAEVRVAITSGIFPPDPKRELLALERLSKKYPKLGINPEEELKILLHAGLSLNANNN